MKISDYLRNQSSLLKSRIIKNHQLVKEILLPKAKNSFNTNPKHKSYNLLETINPKKDITEILKDENNLFIDLYTKTKKYYPTKVEETFKDLILQYKNNDYKIPDLSDKKNLFNKNPLLLVGRELDQFYQYNEKIRSSDKNPKNKLSRKHINFIKKEILFMEKMVNKNSEINKNSNLTNNNNNEEEDDTNYKKEKINYFMVDTVWDKIKEQKKKIKNFKAYEKRKKEKEKMLAKSSKKLKIYNENKLNKSHEIQKFIYSYKTISNTNKNDKNNQDIEILKSENSIGTIKNFPSKDTIKTHSTFFPVKTKKSESESPIKKLKNNLLNIKTINENEESNKLQKEINKIKDTLKNRKLIEKNIILEKTPKRKKNIKKNEIEYQSIYKSIRKNKPNFTSKNSFPILSYYEKPSKEMESNNYKKKFSVQVDILPKKNKNEPYSQKTISSFKLLDLINKNKFPYPTFNKLLKERDPQKYMDIISNIDLTIFNRKEIEKLMRSFCEKILGYTEKETERIININRNDENIYRIIEALIRKTKKSSLKYYGTYDLRNSLDKVNNTIYDLKRKFLYGKIDYNYES